MKKNKEKKKKDKLKISFNDSQKFVQETQEILKQIQNSLFEKAKKEKEESFAQNVTNWVDFLKALDQRKFVLAPHCDDDKKDENGKNCEDIVKDRSGEKKVEKKKKKSVEKKEVEKKRR